MESPNAKRLLEITRRHFFGQTGFGIGTLALSALLGDRSLSADTNPLAPKKPQFAPKAKSVIYLFMAGAPSQLDLFDYKPKLNQYDGQTGSPRSGERRAIRLHSGHATAAGFAASLFAPRPERRRSQPSAAQFL